jgi:cephalosporin-C deacetylase-like acetyl esterase
MPFGEDGGKLNARAVSSFTSDHCTIENVIFESFPGWEVNASVFVPKTDGTFPAVVIPVGHSGKQFENYQIVAQAYAALGFVAILFDPPGQSSEKQRGNDHFRDGVRSSLLGLTPNRYFVLDALRSIDYLETRDDVDTSRGVSVTGVSGGGVTTIYAALFDDRINCVGPSCCMNSLSDHPIGDYYSACPEQFWHGRLRDGVDNLDLALSVAPTPLLYMAGKHDEVFQIEPTRELVARVAGAYAAQNSAQRFGFFEDDAGHAYTVAQTLTFARWIHRWVYGNDSPGLPEITRDEFEMLDYEKLKCYPSQDVTMFSITREMGRQLASSRSHSPEDPDTVTRIVGSPAQIESWRESNQTRLWTQGVSEAICTSEGLEMPMTILRPWDDSGTRAAVVWVDEDGRAAALESYGTAVRIGRVLDRNPEVCHPHLYVVDPPGVGDSRPMVAPYQMVWWGSMDRIASYFSYGNGDCLLSITSRAVAGLIDSVADRLELADRSVFVCGTGYGGLIATLAAAISQTECSLCTIDSLASFQHLLEEEHYQWPAAAFMGDALNHFDLPELLQDLSTRRTVTIINPTDGRREALSTAAAEQTFAGVAVATEADEEKLVGIVLQMIDQCAS